MPAPTSATLHHPPDDREAVAKRAPRGSQRPSLAPTGQLVLPGHAPAQLGLDSQAYAPTSSGEAASPYLGPSHEVSPSVTAQDEWRRSRPVAAPEDPPVKAPGGWGGSAARRVAQPATQYRLDLDALDDAPQLDLWHRLEVARGLLRGGAFDRQAKCSWVRRVSSEEDIHGQRFSSGSKGLRGLVKCAAWTCPCCGPQRARKTTSALACTFCRHLEALWSDVWMLTLTTPHTIDEDLADIVTRLYRSSELFFESREWETFSKRWGIVGRVRVLDAKHGERNGCHPHFHIALFPTTATLPTGWVASEYERRQLAKRGKFERVDRGIVDAMVALARRGDAAPSTSGLLPIQPLRGADQATRLEYLAEVSRVLVPAWERAVLAAGTAIEHLTHFRENALELTPSENAMSYFTKWGLADEVGAPTAKSRTHLRLLDAVAAGVDRAGDAFLSFRRATDGRAWVTGLEKIMKRYNVTDEDCTEHQAELRRKRELQAKAEGKPLPVVAELEFRIRPYVYAGALAIGWPKVFAAVDAIAASNGEVWTPKAQRELDAYLWWCRVKSDAFATWPESAGEVPSRPGELIAKLSSS